MSNLKQKAILLAFSVSLAFALIAPEVGIAFGAFLNPYSNTVTATMNIPNTCTAALANTLINFGSVPPAANAPITNVVTDTNDGNIAANILLDGTNWISGGNNFYVTNTFWDFSVHASGVNTVSANILELAPGNVVDTGNIIPVGIGQDLFFGVTVPSGQVAATYTQTITIENKC